MKEQLEVPVYLGYIALLICILFFGSVSLPVKKFETGDGMFYQLISCIGIWIIGFCVNCLRSFPKFYYLPMLGGALWTTANVNTVPIIKMIGIGIGTLIWGTVAILVGWSNARFGIFGTKPEIPNNAIMNYFGVALTALSAIFYFFVKTDITPIASASETTPLLSNSNENALISNESQSQVIFDRLSPRLKHIFGIILSVVAGCFFAATYIPYLYVIDTYEDSSKNGLDYVFSMYTGIFISQLIYFTIYALCKKNSPFVNPTSIVPALISGLMWGIANSSFLLANCVLSQSVTFPIAGSLPSALASLYSILIFREINGKRNILILISGFCVSFLGSLLCSLSK